MRHEQERAPGEVDILLVCTGNQCRSPMAAAMLARQLSDRRAGLKVDSAGLVSDGVPIPAEVERIMTPLGFDLCAHRSRRVSVTLLESAKVVIGMTRQHVVDLSQLVPNGWLRTFTLSEIVRLGETGRDSRRSNESLSCWVARIGAGRHRAAVLDLPLSEDVPDPIGKPLKAYLRTRDQLMEMTARLADLIEPV